jgi:hypothetical protein
VSSTIAASHHRIGKQQPPVTAAAAGQPAPAAPAPPDQDAVCHELDSGVVTHPLVVPNLQAGNARQGRARKRSGRQAGGKQASSCGGKQAELRASPPLGTATSRATGPVPTDPCAHHPLAWYPTTCPSRLSSSSATRSAVEIAATRRGCVTPTAPARSGKSLHPKPASYRNWGTCSSGQRSASST